MDQPLAPKPTDVMESDETETKIDSPRKTYTWEEVKKHITPEDAWIVYHVKVYDVSNWVEHPGGAVIFTHVGDDMTDIFAAFHAKGSHNMIDQFYIGDLIMESVE